MTERQKIVIAMRFGLVNGEIATLEEVGESLGVTRERIRQIELVALSKLRNGEYDRKKGSLSDYLDESYDDDPQGGVREYLRLSHEDDLALGLTRAKPYTFAKIQNEGSWSGSDIYGNQFYAQRS